LTHINVHVRGMGSMRSRVPSWGFRTIGSDLPVRVEGSELVSKAQPGPYMIQPQKLAVTGICIVLVDSVRAIGTAGTNRSKC
jgi:hypothetical protein